MQDQDEKDLRGFLAKLRTPEAARVILEIVAGAGHDYRALLFDLLREGASPARPGVRILKGPDGEVIEHPYCRSKGWVVDHNQERYTRFLALLKENKKPKEIARETDTPIGTVYYWLRRMEVGRSDSGGPHNEASAGGSGEDDLTGASKVLTLPEGSLPKPA